MWKCIEVNNKSYAISLQKDSNIFNIFLTDFINIWSEKLITETLVERCKVLNPLLKIELLNVEETVEEILSEIPEVPEIVTEEPNSYKMTLFKNIKGGKFKLQLKLHKGSDQEFFEIVTKSICSMTINLNRKYSALLKIVKQKDAEIADYKAEGTQLKRKNIETKPFTEDSLNLIQNTLNETCENTVKSLVNFCNEAESLDFRCFQNNERSHLSQEVKIENVNTSVSTSNNIEGNLRINAGETSKNNSEEFLKNIPKESLKNNSGENLLATKRRVKGITATFTKPIKKSKKKVTSFIS